MATGIEEDLRGWSRQVLEVPNKYLKGLPACPYAKKAWKENKVLVVEAEDVLQEAFKQCKSFYKKDKELIVVASYALPDIEAFNYYIDCFLNQNFPKLHCMGFHPDYGAEDAELDFLADTEWESQIDEDYCMIFIQDLELVVKASDKLKPLGYYEVYPKEEYEALVVDRKRRLHNGDETS